MSGGFDDLGLLPEMVRAATEQGWALPSAVQDEAIPLILGGGDVMVAAETGSGKTGAFVLPAIQLAREARLAASARAAAGAAAGGGGSADGGRGGGRGGGGGGGEPAGKRPRLEDVALSDSDRSAMVTVRDDGLAAQCRSEREWGSARATRGVAAGRAYYEATMTDEGLCRVGWSVAGASLDVGTDRGGYGFGGTGKRSHDQALRATARGHQ